MANGLQISSQNSSLTASATFFATLSDTQTITSTTETSMQYIVRSQGTLSNMFIRIISNTVNVSTTITLRKNAVNANETVSVNANTTGSFSDATHNDTVNAGDLISLGYASGTGNINQTIASNTFSANTNTVSRIGRSANFSYTSANTYYSTPIGFGNTAITAEAAAKNRQKRAGTYQNAAVYVSINNTNLVTTWNGRKNGANGNLTVSITNNTTGVYEDLTHSDSVVAGDDFNYSYVKPFGSNNAVQINGAYADFVSTAGDCILSAADHTKLTVNTSITDYFPLAGMLASPSTTETDMNVQVNGVYAFSALTANIQANSITNACTLTLRANGVSAGVSVSIPASSTGVFSDDTDTYTSASSDLMNYQLVTASTGTSITISHLSVWINNTPVSPTPTGFPRSFVCLPQKPMERKLLGYGGRAPTFGI